MNRQTLTIALVTVAGLFAAGVASIAVLVIWVMSTVDNKIEFGNQSELYYSSQISREEAQEVADYLASVQEDWNLKKQVSYRLDRVNGRLTFGAVVLEGYEKDLLTMTFMLNLTESVSNECFDGEVTDFYAYDEYFKVKRVLTAEEGLEALVSDFAPESEVAELN